MNLFYGVAMFLAWAAVMLTVDYFRKQSLTRNYGKAGFLIMYLFAAMFSFIGYFEHEEQNEGTVRTRCMYNDENPVYKEYMGVGYMDKEIKCGGIITEVRVKGVWRETAKQPPIYWTDCIRQGR